MSATPILHHVNLKTPRLQDMVDCYAAVAGCEVIHVYPGGTWLTNDEASLDELHERGYGGEFVPEAQPDLRVAL